MIKILTLLSFSLSLFLFASCSNTSIEKREYLKTDIESLQDNPQKYDGQFIKVEGYIIGNEYLPSKTGLSLLILTISKDSQPLYAKENQIIFPNVKYKIRAAEDGYNLGILKKCNKLSVKFLKSSEKVIIYGQFKPRQSFFQYDTGVPLNITQIQFKKETIYSDYNDKSAFAHEAPGIMRKIYTGGKKLLKATGKAL